MDYETQIQTIFNSNCTNCHVYGHNSGLNLASYTGVMAGGNSGAVIVPGDHANSLLWQKVNSGVMPPGNNPDLSADEINLIAQWIDEGALETHDVAFQPQTKQELQTAVDLWVSDNDTALETYGEINEWDVSLITDMSMLFNGYIFFNDDISSWDVSNVTIMEGMFESAENFNQDLSSWDVSNVTGMSGMFSGTTNFNQDLSTWNVSNVTDMMEMFEDADSFNQDLSAWDVSSVTDIRQMFSNATRFNQDISAWDVSGVTNMESMFYHASDFNQDISAWDVSSVTDMGNMFEFAAALSDENKCAIHTSFSSNSAWPYDWSSSCGLTLTEFSLSPDVYTLHQNYPNPFNPTTTLRYDLPVDALVNITICDMMGRVVKTLINDQQTAGYRSLQWNATNDTDSPVSAGIYLYMIQAGDFRQTKKMVLLK